MLLTDLWGDDPQASHFILALNPGDNNPKTNRRQLRVQTPAQAEAYAQDFSARGWDVYYAPAQFDGGRTQDRALTVPALWLDLDCGPDKAYADIAEALGAVQHWARQHQIPAPTHVVHSGYGLHVYWQLARPVSKEEWQPVAQAFKQALAVAGVQADPTATADSARVLRVPGTLNHKHSEPSPVRILHRSEDRVPLEVFAAALPKVGPQRVVDPKPQGEWAVPDNYPPGNAEVIAEKCAQLAAFREKRGAVSEPYWRAALSVLSRCDKAEHYVHEWSKGDPRYNPQETQAKADRTGGPALCQTFSEVNPGGCAGCPLAGKITSPIQASAPVAEPPPPDTPWRLSKFKRYTITDEGIWYEPPKAGETEEPAKRVAHFPMWVLEVRERAKLREEDTEGAAIQLEWRSLDGQMKRGLMAQPSLFEPAKFKAWMAEAGVAIGIQEFQLMTYYIAQLTADTLKRQGVTRYHEHLGWHDEGFVVGDRTVTPSGVKASLVQTANPIAQLSAPEDGSLQAWCQAVRVLEQPGYEHHAFALLASFASPLLHLAGWQAAVLSLAGASGGGKTLSMKVAMSVWGDHNLLVHGAQSSMNAIERQLGCNRHVPYGLDEITLYTSRQAASLVYMAANGMGDAKLRRDGSNRQVGQWRNVTFVTTNRALLDFGQTEITEAHRRRVLELFFPRAMDKQDGKVLADAHDKHYGLACLPYMQRVLSLRSQIPQLMEQTAVQLQRQHRIPDAQRFGLWLLAAAAVGGSIARAAGLLTLDIPKVVAKAAESLSDSAANTLEADDLAQQTINEWLAEHNDHICHWPEGANGMNVDSPLARMYGPDKIAVHRAALNKVLSEAGISPRSAKLTFAPPVRPVEDRKVRLAPDTPPVWSYIFDARELGFELEQLGGSHG